MLFKSVLCAAAAAGSAWATPIASETEASCSGNKAIDNFSGWANKTNSLGSIVGDDKTMASVSVSGSTLSMNTKAGSYFFENLPCEDVAAAGYSGIAFKTGGPAQSSFLVEIQTKTDCNATAHHSAYHNVTVPSAAGVVTIPFSEFANATLGRVTSLTFSTFNKTGDYTLGSLEFVCTK